MRRDFFMESSNGSINITVDRSMADRLDTSQDKRNIDIISLLISCWCALLADSPLSTSCGHKPRRTIMKFLHDFSKRPLRETIKTYSTLADKLMNSPELTGTNPLTGVWIPEFSDTPVFKEYHKWYQDGDPQLYRYLLTFLRFGKKFDYDDDELKTTAFREWRVIEEKLSGLSIDRDITTILRRIIDYLVPDLPFNALRPKFGPGAVEEAQVRGVISKSNNIRFDPKIDRVLFKNHHNNYGAFKEGGFHPDEILPDPSVWNSASGASDRHSRLMFVPKDIGKARSVCMEPNTYMFAQQAYLTHLNSMVKHGPGRRYIDITDQSRNQQLADYGSCTGFIDTIDLSSASDSVSVELVRQAFPKRMLYYLLGTRTSKVLLPDGTYFDVMKFAPMGSALCFPVQSIIFTSIVLYAAMQWAHGLDVGCSIPLDAPWSYDIQSVDLLFQQTPGYIPPGRRKLEPASVYGDDICVDSKLTPYVAHLLATLGFIFNKDKSFMGNSAFRESCGGYYLSGADVTPLNFKVKRFQGSMNPECVASMIACANRAGDWGYLTLRKVLIQRLLYGSIKGSRSKVNPLIFSSDRSQGFAIYSESPRNTHLRSRYNVYLQRDEYLCFMMSPSKKRRATRRESNSFERYLYRRWWDRHYGGVVTEEYLPSAPRYDAIGTRLKRVWTPLSA